MLAWGAAVAAAAIVGAMVVGCGALARARGGDGGCGASVPSYAAASVERWFRLDWSVTRGRKGPELQGYVYNNYGEPADHMVLAVERLDASGQVVGCSRTWISGSVPADNRAYFGVPVPDGSAAYRVRILSFEWLHGPGSGM